MIKIHLLGELSDVCGVSCLEAICKDLYDVVSCLRVNFPAFQQYLLQSAQNGQDFTIRYGSYYIDDSEIDLLIGRNDVVICPVPIGSSMEAIKIIGGAVLVAVSAYFGFAPGVMAGIALIANGLLDIITPNPKKQEQEEQEKSSLFGSPVNTIKDGGIVPIPWGECYIGSQVISFDIRSFQTFEDDSDDDVFDV